MRVPNDPAVADTSASSFAASASSSTGLRVPDATDMPDAAPGSLFAAGPAPATDFAAAREALRRDEDASASLAAYATLGGSVKGFLYDDGGLYTRQGRDALNVVKDARAFFDDQVGTLSRGLSGEAATLFASRAERLRTSLMPAVARHESRERANWNLEQAKSVAVLEGEMALLNFGDDRRFSEGLARYQELVGETALRGGCSPERVQELVLRASGELQVDRISRLAQTGDFDRALTLATITDMPETARAGVTGALAAAYRDDLLRRAAADPESILALMAVRHEDASGGGEEEESKEFSGGNDSPRTPPLVGEDTAVPAAEGDPAQADRTAPQRGVQGESFPLPGESEGTASPRSSSPALPRAPRSVHDLLTPEMRDEVTSKAQAILNTQRENAAFDLLRGLTPDEALVRIATPEGQSELGLDAEQAARVGGLLRAERTHEAKRARRERDARLGALAASTLACLTDGKTPADPRKAIEQLRSADLDATTRALAIASVQDGSFGDGRYAYRYSELTDGVISQAVERQHLHEALFCGDIDRNDHVRLTGLYDMLHGGPSNGEGALGNMGGILMQAWAGMVDTINAHTGAPEMSQESRAIALQIGAETMVREMGKGNIESAVKWMKTEDAQTILDTVQQMERHEAKMMTPLTPLQDEQEYVRQFPTLNSIPPDSAAYQSQYAGLKRHMDEFARNPGYGRFLGEEYVRGLERTLIGASVQETAMIMAKDAPNNGEVQTWNPKAAAEDSVRITEDSWNPDNPYYRPNIPWNEGMTVADARYRSVLHDKYLFASWLIAKGEEGYGPIHGKLLGKLANLAGGESPAVALGAIARGASVVPEIYAMGNIILGVKNAMFDTRIKQIGHAGEIGYAQGQLSEMSADRVYSQIGHGSSAEEILEGAAQSAVIGVGKNVLKDGLSNSIAGKQMKTSFKK